MPSDPERIATIEQIVLEIRGDILERKDEEGRTRDRLHKLEGLVGMMVERDKDVKVATEVRHRRMELRVQMLTATVAVVGIVEPFLYHLAQP